ncbi:preprotein translocase subunit SecA [Luteitalea pratensis]|uniref:Protein translocase subunit SecA n=1 Tax=Luteitalea pratensis TaxID=1855912 RepID=A0A143PP82_LUTPR|nr:preprotein translocase subunit SecA [Luteitalea pratensis]AMY10231.1 preprotein translocase subunit SecA [Luteitalea pratensis]
MVLDTLLSKVIGTQNERELKRIQPLVARINELEPAMQQLSDTALRARTAEFRERFAKGETLEDLLPEAFAVVREAGRRVIHMRHYDVQLIGGIVLHRGRIAEMKTGEGKTLVATLPAYLNALAGKGVHVVTVNDYLARRDSEWMGRIYRFLDMSVGVIQHDLRDDERQRQYGADITYGTNNEFGFDYLRDNMKFDLAQMVLQRGHFFAIVDEVDSILIDEARTPLIISGPAEESTDLYYEVDRIIPQLKPGAVIQGQVKSEEREALELTGDYIVDEKHKTATLTEGGMAHAEQLLAHRLLPGGLYDPANMPLLHHVQQGLRAHTLFRRDVEYLVNEAGEVVIIDEHTGRVMPGRRWSDGLHQAVEAKEAVKIERENQTLATITFQNFFRKYDKLSGMTGTADTEAEEFNKIYKLDVIQVPTNRPLIRIEEPDTVFRTQREKYEAIVDDIASRQAEGRPVLVGTVSVEKSELLSTMLKRKGVKHVVLNAKYHAQEAEIVAQAGRLGKVTVATNMAGRGTDILLGGNAEYMARQQCLAEEVAERVPRGEEKYVDDDEFVYFRHLDNFYRVPTPTWEHIYKSFDDECRAEHEQVVSLGGLHIVGTERHESRRIDNQLRGRAGRQGDPGSSRFYLSLEDDLMRIFGSANISGLMQRLGMEEGVPIESRMVTKAIQRAQKQVEAQNFGIRKHLLEYDDVMNKQRESVYALRLQLLQGRIRLEDGEVDSREYLLVLADEVLANLVEEYAGNKDNPELWDLGQLREETIRVFDVDETVVRELPLEEMNGEQIRAELWAEVEEQYVEKESAVGRDLLQLPDDVIPQIAGPSFFDQIKAAEGDARLSVAGRSVLAPIERNLMLQVVDGQWKDHLYSLDHLKEGIGLRGYGQRDPLVEYKKESYTLFAAMKQRVDEETVRYLWRLRPTFGRSEPPPDFLQMADSVDVAAPPSAPRTAPPPQVAQKAPAVPAIFSQPKRLQENRPAPSAAGTASGIFGAPAATATAPRPARVGGDDVQRTVRRDVPKVGRNDDCPCGSGKKYKKCHGAGL